MELSEGPAAPSNDTSVWPIGDFLAWTALSSPTSVTWWNTSAGGRTPSGPRRWPLSVSPDLEV